MTNDEMKGLIYRLYYCLLNHPPEPQMFKERTRLLGEAYALVRDMEVEEPYAIPGEN